MSFFEFDKKAIGSANDTGWYGKGFYFAFAEREARDAASRYWRSDEAIKETRPDIDRTDVVFSDGGVGKANFGDVFYDINLEVDQYLPHTDKDASDINRSTSDDSIPDSTENVNDSSKYSLPLSNHNDLHRSNIEKVTELSRVAAQLTAHINTISARRRQKER